MGQSKKTNGLGDLVKAITTALGVKPCEQCRKNADYLNVAFPFHRVQYLNFDEVDQLTAFIGKDSKHLKHDEWVVLYAAFNRTFNTEVSYCKECDGQNKMLLAKMLKLYAITVSQKED